MQRSRSDLLVVLGVLGALLVSQGETGPDPAGRFCRVHPGGALSGPLWRNFPEACSLYLLARTPAAGGFLMTVKEKWTLHLRWLAANAFGELFGLGLSLTALALYLSRAGEGRGMVPALISLLVAVASGVFEATVVSFAQFWAMRPWFPALHRRNWWLGTLAGALLAYLPGYLPSTLMDMGAASGQSAPAAEPEQWLVLLLAAGLGLAAGALLAVAQWLALRKAARGAGVWIPANMLAWALSMPLIFLGIDLAQKVAPLFWTALFMAGILLLAGALVGAVHGLFLVRIAAKNRAG
jgi:hypothetical protein